MSLDRTGSSGSQLPSPDPGLPLVLAGPILRAATPERVVFWLATSQPVAIRMRLSLANGAVFDKVLQGPDACIALPAGRRLHLWLLVVRPETPLPVEEHIDYDLMLQPIAQPLTDPTAADACLNAHGWLGWRDWAPTLAYPGQAGPGFRLRPRVHALLHGSCRKPHHDRGGDGLAVADRLLARCLASRDDRADTGDNGASSDDHHTLPQWPSLLLLSGDQIYADDVAGPMLRAIHQLLGCLGLPEEPLPESAHTGVGDSAALYRDAQCYYGRARLLPRTRRRISVVDVLFSGAEKPVFTSDNAHNHLMTLGEVLCMYLLVWSPSAWTGLDLSPPAGLAPTTRARYADERSAIERFRADLPAVQRVLAHLPVAMIFDDHDVTDDWNLSREWERIAYEHPFSRRVIGNALIGYLLCQGWGNRPEAFPAALMAQAGAALVSPGGAAHEGLIDTLLRFEQWNYEWPTTPPLVVLDSRTRRWRSERNARQPSGLLDWEAITDLQQTLRGHPAVLLVSPAPIFGVKLIETIQRVFTFFGHPLMVDAENWMAHPGAADAILNVFRHPRTPQHFVVLSGDVHYSFVYDVRLRAHEQGPDIWQICSSGLRNEFPPRLLDALDRGNRWLYAPRSPLNWLTRRRRMRIVPRKPEGTPTGRRLLNASGIGLVELDDCGRPWRIRQLLTDGGESAFTRREAEARWD